MTERVLTEEQLARLNETERGRLLSLVKVLGVISSAEALQCALDADQTLQSLPKSDPAYSRFYRESEGYLQFAALLERAGL